MAGMSELQRAPARPLSALAQGIRVTFAGEAGSFTTGAGQPSLPGSYRRSEPARPAARRRWPGARTSYLAGEASRRSRILAALPRSERR
jgi:hypothetical protein